MKNIYGQLITKAGAVDQRQFRNPVENDGMPYMYYEVLHKPGDKRCWHVVSFDAKTGAHLIVSRHVDQKRAIRAANTLRIKQPDRKAGPKMRYKLTGHL